MRLREFPHRLLHGHAPTWRWSERYCDRTCDVCSPQVRSDGLARVGDARASSRADQRVGAESLDWLRVDSDEDGFHLIVATDEGERGDARIIDVDGAAADLRVALATLDGYIAERERERSEYGARAEVLQARRDALLAISDEAEAARVAADYHRKAERESR